MTIDHRRLGRLVSRVERSPEKVGEVVAGMGGPREGHVVGITGPPGSGKSSLVGVLARQLAQAGAKVAVVALDPASWLTGGAVLGDRLRMQQLENGDVYVRSMASRAGPAVIGRPVTAAIEVVAAAGYDSILLETVGAGQDQIGIRLIADTIVLVDVPGAGDEVQALKAGLTEIADILVVNKSDLPGAGAVAAGLRALASGSGEGGDRKPVLLTSTIKSEGIAELAEAIRSRQIALDRSERDLRRRVAAEAELRRLVSERLSALAIERVGPAEWDSLVRKVATWRMGLDAAGQGIVDRLVGKADG